MRLAIAATAIGLAAVFAASAHADTRAAARTSRALPGLHRVVTAEPYPSRQLSVFGGGGAGLARGALCAGDTGMRASGVLAAGLGIQDWLALAVQINGRHDRYTCQLTGDEVIRVADPRIELRARVAVNQAWHVGGQLALWLPSAQGLAPVTGAATVDAVAAVSFAPPAGRLRASANLGVRLDQSAHLARRRPVSTRAQRLLLGASDAHALLVGAGVSYDIGPVEALAEWTWDWLVGPGAPPVAQSPMRLATGVRVPVGRGVLAHLVVEANLAELPDARLGGPLVRFEPQLTALVGVSYGLRLPPLSFPSRRRAAAPDPAPDRAQDTDHVASVKEPEDPPDPPPALAAVHGTIQSERGAGIPGALVRVTIDDEPREVMTDGDGGFQLADLPAGALHVAVSADRFESATQVIELAPGDTHELTVRLTPSLPPAQLRGLVRSFQGAPLSALLTIEHAEPVDSRDVRTGADGAFEIDVAPGAYTVVIRADGYTEQRRRVIVEDGGVTILNVDLRRERR